MPHIPVMVQEVLQYLLHAETKMVFEGTLGLGNHSEAILSANSNVSLVGVDRDAQALSIAKERLEPFGERITLVEGVFGDVDVHLRPFGKVDGAFLDLGFSTDQIETDERGFSYMRNGPLDMRMDAKGKTARDVIAESGATPTFPGAETVVEDPELMAFLDHYSVEYAELAERAWQSDTYHAGRKVTVPFFGQCDLYDIFGDRMRAVMKRTSAMQAASEER